MMVFLGRFVRLVSFISFSSRLVFCRPNVYQCCCCCWLSMLMPCSMWWQNWQCTPPPTTTQTPSLWWNKCRSIVSNNKLSFIVLFWWCRLFRWIGNFHSNNYYLHIHWYIASLSGKRWIKLDTYGIAGSITCLDILRACY